MGQKLGGCATFAGRAGAEAYMYAKFHLDLCNRSETIHQRHRQDRTDSQTDRQWSDSIGRTILQTVAQKRVAFSTLTMLVGCQEEYTVSKIE